MNIFELILNCDNTNSTPLVDGLILAQNNWLNFKSRLDQAIDDAQFDEKAFQESWINIVTQSNYLIPIAINYYFDLISTKIKKEYTKKFFDILNINSTSNYDELSSEIILQALEYLYKTYFSNKYVVDILELKGNMQLASDKNIGQFQVQQYICDKYTLYLFKTTQIKHVLYKFIELEFKKFKAYVITISLNSMEQIDIDFIEEGEFQEGVVYTKYDNSMALRFTEIIIQIGKIKLLEDIIYLFLKDNIEKCINFYDNNGFGNPYLIKVMNYCERLHKTFLEIIFSNQIKNDQYFKEFYTEILNKLINYIYEFFVKTMIGKLFNIILDAESININLIHEMREGIEKTNMLHHLGSALSREIKSRLLISGVLTQNIINYFISTIKILQLLDPLGLIFDSITFPIKSYLLQRPDALRGIITILTEDSESYTRLGQESIKIPSRQQAENIENYSSDEDEQQAEKWQVLSLSKKSVKYKESDMVTWLVNLYGSQEAFIGEYQNMLAEKLVCGRSYNIDEEIRNLELLKLKFGDNYLQNCNIIVKDVKESKRVNNNIHKTFDEYYHKKEMNKKDEIFNFITPEILKFDKLNAIFISKGYWPINYEFDSFKFPPQFTQIFEEYSKCFSKTKVMRKLIWHHSLGSVDLSLTFDNGDFEFKCLPIHAVLISYFDDTYMKSNKVDGLTLDMLAKELEMEPNLVKQFMTFWVHKGVVHEVKGSSTNQNQNPFQRKSIAFSGYFANDHHDPGTMMKYVPVKIYEQTGEGENWDFYDDMESELQKNQSQLSGDTTQFNILIEGLIISMLNTNGPKTAEKIHNLLKTVYKTDMPYNYNESQTKEILRKMLGKQKISYNGEVYTTRV